MKKTSHLLLIIISLSVSLFMANSCRLFHVMGVNDEASLVDDCGTVSFTYRGEQVTYGTIQRGGLCWMDRNLGASRVPKSRDDRRGYGDLFQWGRSDDGHQDRRSSTVNGTVNLDDPEHGDFITISKAPYDWRSPQNDELWQGEGGVNNPCPPEWRLPTESELFTEVRSWSSRDSQGAYKSTLEMACGR